MGTGLPLSISMLMLGVGDLEQSVVFYRDRLQLTLQHRSAEFAFLGAGAITLILSVPLGRVATPRAGAVEVIFPAQSVSATHLELLERGCEFVQGPHEVTSGSWAANFRDPDGHLLSIFGPY